jgi:hypothetical protein
MRLFGGVWTREGDWDISERRDGGLGMVPRRLLVQTALIKVRYCGRIGDPDAALGRVRQPGICRPMLRQSWRSIARR